MNVGLLTYWARGSGLAHVARTVAEALMPEHAVHILKQGTETNPKRFPDVASVDQASHYCVPQEEFESWLARRSIDVAFFFEYDQWLPTDGYDLVAIAREHGARTIGQLVAEKLDPANRAAYAQYDVTLAVNEHTRRRFEALGLENVRSCPWGVDLAEFDAVRTRAAGTGEGDVVFFHPRGRGGYRKRKNTDAVLAAFTQHSIPGSRLVVSWQYPEGRGVLDYAPGVTVIEADLGWDAIRDLYQRADVVVLPSRWESIGLPLLEAQAAGRPVITTDAPPMNETVVHRTTGLVVPLAGEVHHDDIFVPAAEVDVVGLAAAARELTDRARLREMGRAARAAAEARFDLATTRDALRRIVSTLAGESR